MPETHLPQDILQSPHKKRTADRQTLLDGFAELPNDETIWNTAFSWVVAEGDQATGEALADHIPMDELIELAKTVRATPPQDRYNLMAQQASTGQLWFDVLQTFTSEQIKDAVQSIVRSWSNERGAFHHALDVGTGTGKSLCVLESSANSVVGVDRNQSLLTVAQQVAGENTRLVKAEVTELPFDDASFDLIASSGLGSALDKSTAIAFYKELARVMTPDGVYIEGSYWTVDGYPGEDLVRITTSSKAMLADMIVDTVSGNLEITDRLSNNDKVGLLEALGLKEDLYDVPSEDGKTHNLITVITKLNQ